MAARYFGLLLGRVINQSPSVEPGNLNRPGFVEAGWFKSDLHRGGLTGELPIVVCLSLCRRYVSDGLKQSVMVELRYPFQRGQHH